ncbi:MAG: hypothetical protein M1816_005624 [Peltula sp. TS41687]|nr:MAG: hypothetical protein M1816_005624 [Peltula sp. TS41687]
MTGPSKASNTTLPLPESTTSLFSYPPPPSPPIDPYSQSPHRAQVSVSKRSVPSELNLSSGQSSKQLRRDQDRTPTQSINRENHQEAIGAHRAGKGPILSEVPNPLTPEWLFDEVTKTFTFPETISIDALRLKQRIERLLKEKLKVKFNDLRNDMVRDGRLLKILGNNYAWAAFELSNADDAIPRPSSSDNIGSVWAAKRFLRKMTVDDLCLIHK